MKNDSIEISKNEKRFLFVINTAGQVYTWRPLIQHLLDKHYEIKIVAREFGPTTKILTAFGLKYAAFGSMNPRSKRIFKAFNHIQDVYRLSKTADPSAILGFGIDAAITAARLRKPCILFIDDDHTPAQNNIARLFCNAIITPQCFKGNLGKKQIRIDGYKEIAYLHPDQFKPDPSIFNDLRIDQNEKYIIVRFNSFDAIHDIGKQGFSNTDKFTVIKTLEKYARVFISAERGLPEALEAYRLPAQPHRIHHVLNYAQLVFADSGTMTTEAAVLGTPAIRCNSIAGVKNKELGNFIELEHKYGLIYCFPKLEDALTKAVELIQRPDLKAEWLTKRNKMLAEKIDVTQYMFNFIEDYLEGRQKLKSFKN